MNEDLVYEIVMDQSGKVISRNTRKKTPAEIAKEREDRIAADLNRQHQLENAKLLRCDECATPIGYVYENDLNGSGFYCQACWEEAND